MNALFKRILCLFFIMTNFAWAAGEAPEFLVEMTFFLLASALITYISKRLGLVPIIGFLIAGVIIGPNALGLVSNRELIDAIAEIGVILLLFTIGLEFSLDKLAKIKKLIFIGGGLQVGLTSLIVTLILMAFGISWQIGLFTGFIVTLSSTAIVLKLMASNGETNSVSGQVNLGLLIFQDLAIILMVMLIPMLAGMGGSNMEIVAALGKAALIIVLVLWLARKVMPAILEVVAKTCTQELFLIAVAAICFGTAYLTSLAGVSVSLGAFLAGLIVSESQYSEHAFSEILPLQIIFSAAFFVSVGMLLDIQFLLGNFMLVLGVVVFVFLLKFLTTGLSALVLGYRLPVAVASGFYLAQIGEFSFVLERVGRSAELFPAGLGEMGSQTMIAASVLLMILTPFLATTGAKLANRFSDDRDTEVHPEMDEEHEGGMGFSNHVIIAGYGEASKKIARILKDAGIPFFITTLNPPNAQEARNEGFPVMMGDATRQRTLILAGISKAKMLVIADDDPHTSHHITRIARMINPSLQIVVRTRMIAEIEPLQEAGVSRVIPEELESIVQLVHGIMTDYQVDELEIRDNVKLLRDGGYQFLRGKETEKNSGIHCHLELKGQTDTRELRVSAGAKIVNEGASEITHLAGETFSILKVEHQGKTLSTLTPDFRFKVGDRLWADGHAEDFEAIAELFRVGELTEEEQDG